jgi:hypothetical protein
MNNRFRILAATGVGVLVVGVLSAGSASADPHVSWTSIPAMADVRGVAAPNALSPQLREVIVAQGSNKIENPTAIASFYGYNGNGSLVPDPALVQSPGHPVEASKTEPDKNTYLRLWGLHGADPNYWYGTHFLYQGHETGLGGYLTRVNLDADAAHRVTVIATQQAGGAPIPVIDGSTWDPWAKRLLFTAELGSNGAVLQSTPDINAAVLDVSFAFGRGGFEGIQNDSAGNVWYVEDVGGASPAGSKAKNPNSFVYRFLPYDKSNLTKGGVAQVLQVISNRSHTPITFQAIDAGHPTGGIFTDDQKDLSTVGTVLDTHWVTIHDTHVDTSGNPFDANAAAKAAGATPFKRPENGQFRPGTDFREFFFDATGDTNATSAANAGFGGWGGFFRLTQDRPGADHGKLQVFYMGNQEHTGLDNVTFIDRDHIAFVEDASDTVHTQRGAFDSGYLFDVRTDYSHGAQPVRFLAEGRDSSATLDNMLVAAGNGFQNEGDNEITGIHMSDGDPTPFGILGAKIPQPFRGEWRLFWTQQHGDNNTWEIISANRHDD